MADDIDDLLDEVESRFLKENAAKARQKTPEVSAPVPAPARRIKSDKKDELSDIIRDICAEEGPNPDDIFKVPQSASNTKPTEKSSAAGRKCLTVLIGGTSCPEGLNSGMVKRCCHKLRCTSCDFQVVIFDDYEWHKDCDYLFLRNNIPDFSRLKPKLTPRRGSRAYACQCSWRSMKQIVEVQKDPGLKWVCGKHS